MIAEPTHIGRYRVVSVLGRGAMGVVYRAFDPEIERAVAIKLVHSHLLSGEEHQEFVARFRREAQAAARCAHPNVVAVYDYALHADSPFLAMEFVDGQSLAAMRQAAAIRPTDAVHIIGQVLAGLAAAHAGGIVHRDVKPANVMLTHSLVAKIADFGISRIENSSLTASGMMVGTPNYMSPEQCRGEVVDARSDLYAVAVMLYELLTGTRPFAGASSGALYVRLASEDAPDIRTHRADLPPALAAAVMRGLARAPRDRFASAAEMAAAIAGAGPVAEAAGADHTAVLPGRVAEPDTAGTFSPELIATIERRLAEHVGPIARYLVQSAVRRVGDFDSLCRKLAANIESENARDQFLRDAQAQAPSASGLTSAGSGVALIDPAQLARVQTALARHLGPVARVLIKRARARSLPELYAELATHIEPPDERAAFLRSAPPA